MFNNPTPPDDKRPVIRPTKSTSWSWPRLVTVQEGPQKSALRGQRNLMATKGRDLPVMDEQSPPSSTPIPASNGVETECINRAEQFSPLSPNGSQEGNDYGSCRESHSNGDLDSFTSNTEVSHPTEDGGRPESNAELVRPTTSGSEHITMHCIEESADSNVQIKPVTNPLEGIQEPSNSEIPPTIPVIKIQGPSRDHSEAGPNEPRPKPTIDSVLAEERKKPIKSLAEQAPEQARSHDTDLVAVLPQPTDLPAGTTIVPVRLRRRKLALRKTRNVLARKTMLKAGLGRQLAIPVKEALRRQAKGEDVTISDIKVIG